MIDEGMFLGGWVVEVVDLVGILEERKQELQDHDVYARVRELLFCSCG